MEKVICYSVMKRRIHLIFIRPAWRTFLRVRECLCRCLAWIYALSVQRNISDSARKISGKSILRVGFYVYNDAVFQQEQVFQLMCKDSCFDPYIVIISGVGIQNNGEDRSVHDRTLASLTSKYGDRVLDSWDGVHVRDLSQYFDICTSMHGYEGYVHKYCRMSYMAKRGVLTFFVDYSFDSCTIWDVHYIKKPDFTFLWRFYTTRQMYPYISRWQPILSRNGRVTVVGSPKIDPIAHVKLRVRERKRIIIAPHHTIVPTDPFYLSNFIRLSGFYKELPSIYPDIDWIFRPHPILMMKMVKHGFWTAREQEEYRRSMTSYPNVEWQDGGDYYDVFVNSDAMIQDCCSFLGEYLVTGHPQCYVLANPKHAITQFLKPGIDMLSHTYQAYTETDIINFIEKVVLEGNDTMRDSRVEFVRTTVATNYPHASECLINDIKSSLKFNW